MSLVRKTAGGALLLALAGVGAYAMFHEYVRATALIVRAANVGGVAQRVVRIETSAVAERDLQVPWRNGTLPARWYSSDEVEHAPILLVPGVHASGLEEPRLVALARDLASIGHPVLTTELADLKRYAITARSTDMIEDAAGWLSRQPSMAPDGRLGIFGISFAGGLSIVAASRASIRDRVAFVMSFGGHGDLPRTLRYLCTGRQPDGTDRPAHDYGVAIILLGVADRVVPATEVEPLRHAILTFLEASRLHAINPEASREAFEDARRQADALREPARALMQYVNDRDVTRLGPVLLPHLGELGGDPALSPSRSRPPAAPVYLLHGADDNVIPAIESTLLADDLRSRGVAVHHLITALITHADVDRPPTVSETWRLVRFWGRLLDE